MKRKRIIEGTGDLLLHETKLYRKQQYSAHRHGVQRQKQQLQPQRNYDDDNQGFLLSSGGKTNIGHRRSGIAMAKIAFYYFLVSIIYFVSFLSSTSFLQVEVATAFAFQLPKPPRIVKNLIKSVRSSRDDEQIAPILQDWTLDEHLSDDGAVKYSLIGTVTGHPAIPDGDVITTAPLETTYIDIANKILLASEENSDSEIPKFVLRRQSSKYTKMIITVSGTKYALLPPSIKISDAPLLSRGKVASEASTDGQLSSNLSYKDQLAYLEEQTEVVRLLAEREGEREKRQKEETAEVIRDAGIIMATALVGAAYFVGDNANIAPAITAHSVIVQNIQDSITEVEESTQTNAGADTRGVPRISVTSGEIEFAQSAKAILPYLEERIKALEEDQQKQQQIQQKSDDKDNENQRQQKQKEEFESESKDSVNVESGVVRDEILTSRNFRKDRDIESSSKLQSKQIDRSESESSITPKTSVQEEMSNIFTGIKETIKQPEYESDAARNTKDVVRIKEGIPDEKQVQSKQQPMKSSLRSGSDVATNNVDPASTKDSTAITKEETLDGNKEEGTSKTLVDVKESIKQPGSESDAATNNVDPTGTKDSTAITKVETLDGNKVSLRSGSDVATNNVDPASTKDSTAIAKEETLDGNKEEGTSKALADVEESIKQPGSESDATTNNVDPTGTKDSTAIIKEETPDRNAIQPKEQPIESSFDGKENESSSTASKLSVQEGMSKSLISVKESIKESDSESDALTNSVDPSFTEGVVIEKEETPDGNKAQSKQKPIGSSFDNKESKPSTTSNALVQEEMSETLADVKESITQLESESDAATNNVDSNGTKRHTSIVKEGTQDAKMVQSKQRPTGSSFDNKNSDLSATSKAPAQEVMLKTLIEVKETNKHPDSESDAATSNVDPIKEETTIAKKLISDRNNVQSKQQPIKSSFVNKENEASSSTTSKVSVQEEIPKKLIEVKESIKRLDSESDAATNNLVIIGAKEDALTSKEMGFDSPNKRLQSQVLQSQKMKVFKKIEKITKDMSVIRQDSSKEFETILSDLAWAGRQVLGDGVVSSGSKDISSDNRINGLTSSALSIFGEDGVTLLYQYSIDAMKTASDVLSLDRMMADLVELSSKMKLLEDPRIAEFLKEYNFNEEKSIQLVAAASLVAIVSVTTAMLVRSQMALDGRRESSGPSSSGYTDIRSLNGADKSTESTLGSLYEDSYIMIPPYSDVNSWESTTDIDSPSDGAENASFEAGVSSFSGETYENDNDPNVISPFPFATSNWEGGSTAFVDDSTWMDTSTDYRNAEYNSSADSMASTSTNLSQSGDIDKSNIIEYGGAENPYLGYNDVPTTSFENSDSDGQFTSSLRSEESDLVDVTNLSKSISNGIGSLEEERTGECRSDFSTGIKKSSFSPINQKRSQSKENQIGLSRDIEKRPKVNLFPFGKPSTLPNDRKEKKADGKIPKSKITPLDASDELQRDAPKANFSTFAASSTLPTSEQGNNNKVNTPNASFSPFGRKVNTSKASFSLSSGSSVLPMAGQDSDDEVNIPKAGISPFARPSALPKSGQESKDEMNITKVSFSPLGRLEANSSPFGRPPNLPKAGKSNDKVNAPKTSFSPFGGPSTLPKLRQESKDAVNSPTVSSSPFSRPPTLRKAKQESSNEINAPKTSFSPFGGPSTIPKYGQESEDEVNSPEASSSPFSRPPTLPKAEQDSNDEINAPKASFSPFGGSSTLPKLRQESEDVVNFPEASSSPFSRPPTLPRAEQERNNEINAPKTSFSPFGVSSTPPKFGQESENEVNFPEAGSSPFSRPSALPKAEQNSNDEINAPKTSFSPFGASSTPPKFGQESKDVVNSPQASFSPFSRPPTLPKAEQNGNDEVNAPKTNILPFGASSTPPKFGQKSEDAVNSPTASSSPFSRPPTLPKAEQESSNEINDPKTDFSPFGVSSTLPKFGQESENEVNSPKASSSPFSRPLTLLNAKQESSNEINAPKTSSLPFVEPSTLPKFGQESEDTVNSPKASSSPFSRPSTLPTAEQNSNDEINTPKTSFSPFGVSSTPPKFGQESKDLVNSPQASSSPFSRPPTLPKAEQNGNDEVNAPKTNNLPFGASSTPPKFGQKSEDAVNSPTASSSPFTKLQNLPKAEQNSNDEINAPKTNFSPFGVSSTPPKFGQESEDVVNSSEASSSPFSRPPTLPKAEQNGNDEINTPKTSFSLFGVSSTPPKFGQESENIVNSFKASSSPFSRPPTLPKAEQNSNDEINAPKTSFSPFGASSTLPKNGQASKYEESNPESSSSPFSVSSNFSTSGQESTDKVNNPKAKSTPFGEQSTLTRNERESKNYVNTSKTGLPPFGLSSSLPKSEQTPNTKFSPLGSGKESKDAIRTETRPNLSPFDMPSNMPRGRKDLNNTTEPSYVPFLATPKSGKSNPDRKNPSDENDFDSEINDSFSRSESNPTEFRIMPKQATKPQNDMYERMRAEQAMRLEEFERNQTSTNGISPLKGGKRFEKDGEENVASPSARLEERRNLVEEKVKIKKKRRVIAQESARLEKEKKKREKKSEEEKKTVDEQTEFDGEKRGNEQEEKEDEVTELSEEDQKEKERMIKIQKLAREQARFEIEARGLPKEEKSQQEKLRMKRLHQLAREQARFEYDRRHANEKRKERMNRIRSTNTASSKENAQNKTGEYHASSTQEETIMEGQNRTKVFQTADTPSNEENIQNRVLKEISGSTKGKKVLQRTSDRIQEQVSPFQAAGIPSNEEKMKDRVRQLHEFSREEDVLMGTKKKIEDRGQVFENSRSISKEEGIIGDKARVEQLENLANKQAQYKNDRTASTSARRSSEGTKKKELFSEESEGQIIDVEVAEDDGDEILKTQDCTKQQIKDKENLKDSKSKHEKESQPLSRQENLEDKSICIENEKQTNMKNEKRKQLEVQARQRSKQQFQRIERLHTDQKDNRNYKHIAPDPVVRAVVIEEQVQKEPETQLPVASESRSHEQRGITKQQKEVANAIMKLDGSYKPSNEALADTSRMLKEVSGFSLSDYKGSKDLFHRKNNVSVYVGRPLSIPVRVSTPGSFIEFSVSKKQSEFDFAILAVPDKGYAIDVKKSAPFSKYAGKSKSLLRDTVLVGAASAPCTLQFKFENNHSTLLEKVIVSYDIKVTSPSKELLRETRRLRTESCLQTIEEDLRGITGVSKSSDLQDEIMKLEAEIEEKTKEIDLVMDEERRWNTLIAKINNSEP